MSLNSMAFFVFDSLRLSFCILLNDIEPLNTQMNTHISLALWGV